MQEKRKKLNRVIELIDTMIDHKEENKMMKNEDKFNVFKEKLIADNEDKYGQEQEDKDEEEEEEKGKDDEEEGADEKEEDDVTEDNGDFSDEDNTDEEDDSGVWNCMTVAARFDSGMGTKAVPVIIKTPAQFALFANKVK